VAHNFVFSKCEVPRLRFDPENPRLPAGVDGADERAVMSWMLADTGLLELLGSIGEGGYFPGDPLLISPVDEKPDALVPPDPKDGGEWFVVEGNRRLAAVQLLGDPSKAPRRQRAVAAAVAAASKPPPTEIPVVAFARRDDILTYLGFRHITGVKEWDPLEKARYLTQLRDRLAGAGEPSDNRTLARSIGSQGPYVGRLLTAYQAMLRLIDWGVLGAADEDDVPFSLLALSLNYKDIVSWLGLERADNPELPELEEERLRRLAEWIFRPTRAGGKTVLGESRNMRLLARVVTSERAVKELSAGTNLRDAALLAEPADALFEDAIEQAASRMQVARDHVGNVDRVSDEAIENLKTIHECLKSIENSLATPK
jgi:hypothetical protein